MRIRSLKPEFFTDRVTGRWPAELALFYQALWVLADDEGRFEWEPEGIRGQLFPYRSLIDPCALMEGLRKTGHVIKYSADGAYYGWLPKFKKHQHPNRPQESKLPDPSLSTHVPLTESSVSTHCKRSLVEESSVRDLESSGEECSGEERRDHRSTDHPCVLKLSATRDEAAGAAREGTDPDSSPELSGSEPSPSEAKALTGGPPTKAATTTDDLGPPPCPGPPEILAHEKPPLSSVESGQIDLPAAPPASATGDGGTAPPPPPKPKKTTPQGEAFDFWKASIWPKLSTVPCPKPTKAEMAQLARRCKEIGLTEITAAMQRAEQDPYWHEKLDLLTFCSKIPKFLPRIDGPLNGKGASPPSEFTRSGNLDVTTGEWFPFEDQI
jgi:hypothetical protein